jgi:hypothetical protein
LETNTFVAQINHHPVSAVGLVFRITMRKVADTGLDIGRVKLDSGLRARHFHRVHESMVNFTYFGRSTRIADGGTAGENAHSQQNQG